MHTIGQVVFSQHSLSVQENNLNTITSMIPMDDMFLLYTVVRLVYSEQPKKLSKIFFYKVKTEKSSTATSILIKIVTQGSLPNFFKIFF